MTACDCCTAGERDMLLIDLLIGSVALLVFGAGIAAAGWRWLRAHRGELP